MRNYFYRIITDQANDPMAQILKVLLWIFSLGYGLGLWARGCGKGCGQGKTLTKPVISIGNLTWGGAGKTPLVEYIAHTFKLKNIRPVILMRGYGKLKSAGASIASEVNEVNDEALLLEDSLPGVPILVGANRFESAQRLPPDYPVDVFLMDDGFQHWKLARQLDIVVIDTTNPFGNRHLLPRGILREPLNALKRAQAIVLTKTDWGRDQVDNIRSVAKKYNPSCLIVESVHKPFELVDVRQNKTLPLKDLDHQKICAFCAIGDPTAFLKTLNDLGAQVEKNFTFMDHHEYQRHELEDMIKFCQAQGILGLVTTQKDAVKLKAYMNFFPSTLNVWSVRVRLEMTKGKAELDHLLQAIAEAKC